VVSVPVPANPTSSNWKAYIDINEELKNDRAAIPGFTTKYKDIGMYVVSHGKTGSIGGLGGDSLAELIKELGFRSLRKVCVVSCFTGGEKIGAGSLLIKASLESSAPRSRLISPPWSPPIPDM
jgi:hypothetical protein